MRFAWVPISFPAVTFQTQSLSPNWPGSGHVVFEAPKPWWCISLHLIFFKSMVVFEFFYDCIMGFLLLE